MAAENRLFTFDNGEAEKKQNEKEAATPSEASKPKAGGCL